jgi:hypothetical protein
LGAIIRVEPEHFCPGITLPVDGQRDFNRTKDHVNYDRHKISAPFQRLIFELSLEVFMLSRILPPDGQKTLKKSYILYVYTKKTCSLRKAVTHTTPSCASVGSALRRSGMDNRPFLYI